MAILGMPPIAPVSVFSSRSQECIKRLVAHNAESLDTTAAKYISRTTAKMRRAAVLVLLYEEHGHLRVLLTTRAKTLRSHPGQTALPGGATDDTDKDIVETAYREAYEEVGLPLQHPSIHTLCTLRPFLAWTRSLVLVTPVVAVVADPTILSGLKASPGEVELIFTHPLEAILDPPLSSEEPLVAPNSKLWPSDAEFYNYTDSEWTWLGNSTYRMHRFRSAAASITGLTSEILIMAASIAYGRLPSFECYAPGQLTTINETLAALDPAGFFTWTQSFAQRGTKVGPTQQQVTVAGIAGVVSLT